MTRTHAHTGDAPAAAAGPVKGREPGRAGMPAWLPRAVVTMLAATAAAIAAADVLNPQYSPVSETVSRYVNGTAGWLITLAILCMGAASAVLVGQLGRLTGQAAPVAGASARRIGRWALAAWAAGVLVAGVFPADPPGQWSNPSTSELVHGMSAWLAFAAFPVAALLLTRALAARWPAGRLALAGCAAASILTTGALAVFLADVMGGPSLGIGETPTLVGLVERLVVAANLAWLGLAAVAAARSVPGGDDPRA